MRIIQNFFQAIEQFFESFGTAHRGQSSPDWANEAFGDGFEGHSRPEAPRASPAAWEGRARAGLDAPRARQAVMREHGDVRVRNALFGGGRRQGWRRAEEELIGQLRANGQGIRAGHIYAVQLDRMSRDVSELNQMRGRTYVFRGSADGGLERIGDFASSSQPTTTGERSRFAATRNRGPAYIRPGLYTVNRNRESTYGGAFRIGGAPAARDANRNGRIDPNEAARNESAGGILFHSSGYGSAGCQILHDFDAFAAAIAQGRGNTFTYVLVRDGDPSQARSA